MSDTWRRFHRNPLAVAGLVVIAVFVAAFDPAEQFFDGLTLEGSPLAPNARF